MGKHKQRQQQRQRERNRRCNNHCRAATGAAAINHGRPDTGTSNNRTVAGSGTITNTTMW
jgi:hypothetical protein